MPYADPRVKAAYMKEYQRRPEQVAKRKARHLNPEQKAKANKACRERDARVVARRREMLEQFPCHCCGEPDPTVIEWHHVYPEDKSFHISHHKHPEDKWWNEVLKCIPVCANCHKKIHKEKLCIIMSNLILNSSSL